MALQYVSEVQYFLNYSDDESITLPLRGYLFFISTGLATISFSLFWFWAFLGECGMQLQTILFPKPIFFVLWGWVSPKLARYAKKIRNKALTGLLDRNSASHSSHHASREEAPEDIYGIFREESDAGYTFDDWISMRPWISAKKSTLFS